MKTKELIEELKKHNPEATVLIRDQFDLAQGEIKTVKSESPTGNWVMVWTDFN